RRSSTISSKLWRMPSRAAMHQWSIRTNRKFRAMGASWRRSAMRPTTARFRLAGTEDVIRTFFNSWDAASAASNARSWLSASSGRRPAPFAVVTSARALAYRVATTESIISDLRLQVPDEPLNEGIFGLGCHAGADFLFRKAHGEFGAVPLQRHAG